MASMELGVPYIALPSFLFQLLAIEMLLFPTDERLHLFLLISSGVEEGNDAFIGIRTVKEETPFVETDGCRPDNTFCPNTPGCLYTG